MSTTETADDDLTVDLVPNCKRLFGLDKNAAYRAAACGQIPCVKLGGKWRVPLRAVEAMYTEIGRRTAERMSQPKIGNRVRDSKNEQ